MSYSRQGVHDLQITCGKISKLIWPPIEYTRFRCANFSRKTPTNFFLHKSPEGLLHVIHLQGDLHTKGLSADHTALRMRLGTGS